MFVISKVLTWLFLPPGLFVILLTCSIFFILKSNIICAKRLVFITAILIYIFSITPVKNMLLKPLEYHYEARKISEKKYDAMVILGGGTKKASLYSGMKTTLSSQSFERTYLGAKLWRQNRIPVIVSGGKWYDFEETEARIMERILIDLSVEQKYIIIENRSRNTIENAIYSKEIINKQGFKNIILITSAYHIRRSVYIFESLGINVTPIVTDYRSKDAKGIGLFDFLPRMNNLGDTYLAFHEYIGLLYTKIFMSIKFNKIKRSKK